MSKRLLTKPCRDNLVGLQRKLVQLGEVDPGQDIIGFLVDHITDVLHETARLDAQGGR